MLPSPGRNPNKPLNIVFPGMLKKKVTKVKSGTLDPCHEFSFRFADPSTWLYCCDAMVEWNPDSSRPHSIYHKIIRGDRFRLPAYAAYDKKSIDKMFKEMIIAPGSDRAKRVAFYYPFNISEAGEVSDPRPFTVDLQQTWRLKLREEYIARNRHDEARLLMVHPPAPLPSQIQNISRSGEAEVSQSSPRLPLAEHYFTKASVTHGEANGSTSSHSDNRVSPAPVKQHPKCGPSTATTEAHSRALPDQVSTRASMTSKAISSTSNISVQTSSSFAPLPQGSVLTRPLQKDQGTQTCAATETSSARENLARPLVVIVGFQDPSTADTRAAMQQAMDILSQTIGNMEGSDCKDMSSIVISNSKIPRQDASVTKEIEAPAEPKAATLDRTGGKRRHDNDDDGSEHASKRTKMTQNAT